MKSQEVPKSEPQLPKISSPHPQPISAPQCDPNATLMQPRPTRRQAAFMLGNLDADSRGGKREVSDLLTNYRWELLSICTSQYTNLLVKGCEK